VAKLGNLFETLKDQFDLPPKAIPLQDQFRREILFREVVTLAKPLEQRTADSSSSLACLARTQVNAYGPLSKKKLKKTSHAFL
jgi:hypothetical protein